MITYDTHIKPYSKKFILVRIDDERIAKIDKYVKELIKVKKLEAHHQVDKSSHYKRFYTGTLGEVALELFFGIEGIVDWSIGDSKAYHKPDLKSIGLNIGVKTVQYGSFPIVFKESYCHEIIMIRWKSNCIYICGLAKKDVLNKYQSIDLIKDDRLRLKSTKTGFYGFNKLKYFFTLNELKSLL